MKTSIIWASLGVLVGSMYACSDDETTTTTAGPGPTSSNQASSTTGQGGAGQGGAGQGGSVGGQSQGGAGGGSCLSCNTYYADCGPGSGAPPTCMETDMCASSQVLWTALITCLCDPNVCADNCPFCNMGGMQMCNGCVNDAIMNDCMAQFDACDTDQ